MAKRKPKKQPETKDAETTPKKRMGRPSVLVGGDLKVFLDEVSIGTPMQAAALVAGFTRATVYTAIKLGKKAEKEGRRTEARNFLDKFRVARAKAERSYVHKVAAGAAGDPGVSKEQKCPHCGEEIVLQMPRPPREPDTNDAKFMLKAINPRVWNPERLGEGKGERPISRLELIGAFAQMGQAVAQEVEDPRARARIGEKWREIYRTLGLDESKVQIEEGKTLDQKRLTNGNGKESS